MAKPQQTLTEVNETVVERLNWQVAARDDRAVAETIHAGGSLLRSTRSARWVCSTSFTTSWRAKGSSPSSSRSRCGRSSGSSYR